MAAEMCPVCVRKKTKRSGLGTCGSRHCLKVMQGWALYGREAGPAPKDARDPAVNKKIKLPSGREAVAKRSATIRGVACYVLKDGTSIPVDRCK